MENCNHEAEHERAVEIAKKMIPADEDISKLCGAFKALSEPSRMKILLALTQGELCVYHIVAAVGGTQSAVSHQLRILRDNRIIRARRDGQNIVYSLADEHVVRLIRTSLEHINCEV